MSDASYSLIHINGGGLALLFVILKLAEVIDWSWWWLLVTLLF